MDEEQKDDDVQTWRAPHGRKTKIVAWIVLLVLLLDVIGLVVFSIWG